MYQCFVGGQLICQPELDFEYIDNETNRLVYEDVKGKDTGESRLKRKLLRACLNIDVRVIRSRWRRKRGRK
jgi:hypothetical protein